MTTDKLRVNALQEESAVSTTKRVWAKPTVEIIGVESGVNMTRPEGTFRGTATSTFAS